MGPLYKPLDQLVRCYLWCPGRDLNPHFPFEKTDFKSVASADFATRAETFPIVAVGWGFVGKIKIDRTKV